MLFYFFSKTEKQAIKTNKSLKNDIVFEGTISNFKISNNHSFGILYIDLKKSNSKKLNVNFDKETFPYRISNNKAEIYCTVSNDRKKAN